MPVLPRQGSEEEDHTRDNKNIMRYPDLTNVNKE